MNGTTSVSLAVNIVVGLSTLASAGYVFTDILIKKRMTIQHVIAIMVVVLGAAVIAFWLTHASRIGPGA